MQAAAQHAELPPRTDCMFRQQQKLLWALVARERLPQGCFEVGAPHHKLSCKPGCKRVACRPTVHLHAVAGLQTLDRVIGGDELLEAAARGCEDSRDELEALVTKVAF